MSVATAGCAQPLRLQRRTPGRAVLTVRTVAAGYPAAVPATPRRRRDRRGRGLRGALLPSSVPAARTRAERFDDLVLDAVEDLDPRWREPLQRVEVAVEDVPPADPSPWEAGEVPLGRVFPADRGLPARVVVYRRPVEARSQGATDLADLVRTVVVEQLAHVLDVSPRELDPGYEGE